MPQNTGIVTVSMAWPYRFIRLPVSVLDRNDIGALCSCKQSGWGLLNRILGALTASRPAERTDVSSAQTEAQ